MGPVTNGSRALCDVCVLGEALFVSVGVIMASEHICPGVNIMGSYSGRRQSVMVLARINGANREELSHLIYVYSRSVHAVHGIPSVRW